MNNQKTLWRASWTALAFASAALAADRAAIFDPITVKPDEEMRLSVFNHTNEPMTVRVFVYNALEASYDETPDVQIAPGKLRFFDFKPANEFVGLGGVREIDTGSNQQNQKPPQRANTPVRRVLFGIPTDVPNLVGSLQHRGPGGQSQTMPPSTGWATFPWTQGVFFEKSNGFLAAGQLALNRLTRVLSFNRRTTSMCTTNQFTRTLFAADQAAAFDPLTVRPGEEMRIIAFDPTTVPLTLRIFAYNPIANTYDESPSFELGPGKFRFFDFKSDTEFVGVVGVIDVNAPVPSTVKTDNLLPGIPIYSEDDWPPDVIRPKGSLQHRGPSGQSHTSSFNTGCNPCSGTIKPGKGADSRSSNTQWVASPQY